MEFNLFTKYLNIQHLQELQLSLCLQINIFICILEFFFFGFKSRKLKIKYQYTKLRNLQKNLARSKSTIILWKQVVHFHLHLALLSIIPHACFADLSTNQFSPRRTRISLVWTNFPGMKARGPKGTCNKRKSKIKQNGSATLIKLIDILWACLLMVNIMWFKLNYFVKIKCTEKSLIINSCYNYFTAQEKWILYNKTKLHIHKCFETTFFVKNISF